MPPYSTQEVEDLHLADPDLAVLVVNSEYRHNLAQRETEGERDYSSRRKTCEAISKKLGVQWLRDVKWKELEGMCVCGGISLLWTTLGQKKCPE